MESASCSCVAGKSRFCNHVLALMFKMCKFTLFSCNSTKDLIKEKDQQSSLACTSQLQQWHKKGGGKNIAPQPVMEVEVTKTKDEEFRLRSGIKSLVYDARMKTTHNVAAEWLINPFVFVVNDFRQVGFVLGQISLCFYVFKL